jgi:hypothetical protein
MEYSNNLTLLSNASNLRAQSTSLYTNQYTDCSFVFEFLPMDVNVSFSVDAVFEKVINNVGLSPVDSVATLNVTASNFSRLFYFKTNDLDNLSNVNDPTNNMSYGVIGTPSLYVTTGVNPFHDISYANANVHAGFANPALAYIGNTSVYQDYVRYTAKSITGGYALSDIFSNETQLLEGVGLMDPRFNASFTELLNNASNCENTSGGMNSVPSKYPYVLSCKTLVDNLLNDATNAGNTSSFVRGQKFLDDLRIQSETYSNNLSNVSSDTVNLSGFADNTYWVIFQPGDVMAVRLTYTPKNGSGNPAVTDGKQLGTNAIAGRSYKIYLRMT